MITVLGSKLLNQEQRVNLLRVGIHANQELLLYSEFIAEAHQKTDLLMKKPFIRRLMIPMHIVVEHLRGITEEHLGNNCSLRLVVSWS
jgi:hypothetical protein